MIKLSDVNTADLVAELETRDPGEVGPTLLILVGEWADAAGNEIIVRPKKAVVTETIEQTSDEETEEDPMAIPPFLVRRDVAPDTNHGEDIPPQPHNQENIND